MISLPTVVVELSWFCHARKRFFTSRNANMKGYGLSVFVNCYVNFWWNNRMCDSEH